MGSILSLLNVLRFSGFILNFVNDSDDLSSETFVKPNGIEICVFFRSAHFFSGDISPDCLPNLGSLKWSLKTPAEETDDFGRLACLLRQECPDVFF